MTKVLPHVKEGRNVKYLIDRLTRFDTEAINEIRNIEKSCKLAEWTIENHKQELISDRAFYLVVKELRSRNSEIESIAEARQIKDKDNVDKLDKILGFLIARQTSEKEFDIFNLGVSQQYQKLGIGSELWDAFLKIVLREGVTIVWLEVRQSNSNAIKFYEKRGFTKTQVRKDYYQAPVESAILMRLEVTK